MDRGVFIGGGLICASFLLAVLLNEVAREEPRAPAPAKTTELHLVPADCTPVVDTTRDAGAMSEAESPSGDGRTPNDARCK